VSQKTAVVDAEGIEHHVSDETLRAMKRFLEVNPTAD
jgi:DtxR family manganese transport transcriptional regulator